MANLSQNPTYLSITSLVCSEITGVTTQLRADGRASVSSYMGSSATIPRLQRNFKKAREVALHYGPGHDCMEYLEPFLDTIRCEETTGVVTQRALSAVHSFLRAELLSLNPSSAPAAMVAVVKAATFCRFEVTDPAADEVRLHHRARDVQALMQRVTARWDGPTMAVAGGPHVHTAAVGRLHRVQRRSGLPASHPVDPSAL